MIGRGRSFTRRLQVDLVANPSFLFFPEEVPAVSVICGRSKVSPSQLCPNPIGCSITFSCVHTDPPFHRPPDFWLPHRPLSVCAAFVSGRSRRPPLIFSFTSDTLFRSKFFLTFNLLTSPGALPFFYPPCVSLFKHEVFLDMPACAGSHNDPSQRSASRHCKSSFFSPLGRPSVLSRFCLWACTFSIYSALGIPP